MKRSRILAVILAAALTVGAVPTGIFASDVTGEIPATVQEMTDPGTGDQPAAGSEPITEPVVQEPAPAASEIPAETRQEITEIPVDIVPEGTDAGQTPAAPGEESGNTGENSGQEQAGTLSDAGTNPPASGETVPENGTVTPGENETATPGENGTAPAETETAGTSTSDPAAAAETNETEPTEPTEETKPEDEKTEEPAYEETSVQVTLFPSIAGARQKKLSVVVSNRNKTSETVRLYLWQYSDEFFNPATRGMAEIACTDISVEGLTPDGQAAAANQAAGPGLITLTQWDVMESGRMVRYIEFAIPGESEYLFDLPLVRTDLPEETPVVPEAEAGVETAEETEVADETAEEAETTWVTQDETSEAGVAGSSETETEENNEAETGTEDNTGIAAEEPAAEPVQDLRVILEPSVTTTEASLERDLDQNGVLRSDECGSVAGPMELNWKAPGAEQPVQEEVQKTEEEAAQEEIPAPTKRRLLTTKNNTLQAGEAEEKTDGAEKEAEKETNGEEEDHRSGDGSNIENISAKWITADSINNGDAALLYRKPDRLESQSVRLQISYALSGEHNYNPGDIVISVPAYIFKDRNGNNCGNLIIPYPEDPSRKQDFNWKLVGDHYELTNTKRMSAATKGYIQFQIEGLQPQQLVDMQVSAPFSATIEVVTHAGNLLYLKSNELTAQFDTEARLTNVNKRYTSVSRVKASQIPENQRIEGEEEYIKVDWYVWGTTNANTYYTIDQTDSIPQDKVVESRVVVADDNVKDPFKQISLTEARETYPDRAIQIGQTLVLQTEEDVHGFVIGADSAEATSITKENIFHGYTDGNGRNYSFSTAYPASQFKPDIEYTFHNRINYVVTEDDPEVTENTNPNVQETDPQLVTGKDRYADAQVVWSYSDPKWIDPGGHFMIVKNGNDDTKEGNRTHKSIYTYSDLHRWNNGGNGFYGIYPSALNELQDAYAASGENGSVRLSYTIDTVGYVLPWMYDGGLAEFSEEELSSRIIGNYNRPIQITTMDTGISIGRGTEKLAVLQDYTFAEIEFPESPWVYRGKPQNINPDGTWTALTAGDGTFKYTRDENRANWPDITLQIQRGGAWQDWAVASWKSGSRVITLNDGTTQTSGVVPVPADTENFRTIVQLQNTEGGPGAEEALQAAIDYDVRAVVNLKSTQDMIARIEEAFQKSSTPSMAVYNGANMQAERTDVDPLSEERIILSLEREGYDSIRGYTTDTSVYPYKSSTQKLSEVDYEARTILIHYSAKVEERSVISDKKSWEQAIKDGRLVSETSGVWRDLLPKGVTPDLDTIKLRKGDTITKKYTIEDYEESGRTLLVVEATLTPTPVTYRSGDMVYYEDVPSISFDAIYDFESLIDFGIDLHNVIAFEGGNEQLGTIKNYSGEPDDPTLAAHKNISTPRAFDGTGQTAAEKQRNKEKEIAAMTDLDKDPQHDGWENFVYAGAWTKIDILSAARTSLYKDVQVNNDGIWSEGTYYTDINGTPKEATEGGRVRTVYEGGQYSYRLRVMSDPSTISADMILYDSLENFYAHGDPNDPASDNDWIDNNAPRWQGTFLGVDTSQLEALGCAPVVYYSLAENLILADETSSTEVQPRNIDLHDGNIWVAASTYSGPLSAVKAVAIDCSYASEEADEAHFRNDENGVRKFILPEMESIVVFIRMMAPSGDAARDYIEKKGVWGESAQAYNNAYLLCTSTDKDHAFSPEHTDTNNYVRKDYTKVGLKEYSVDVEKKWNDDNDRDGKRPESVTVHLLADGVDTGKTLTLVPDTTTDEDGKEVGPWKGAFKHIPYTTPEGKKILYTVQEDEVEGYTSMSSATDTGYLFTNTHVPEKTTIFGEKTWEGDETDESVRPASIDIELYANGKKIKNQTVVPEGDGTWKYEFTDLFKYENGEEIVYTVKEVVTPKTDNKLDSYIPVQSDENFDIKNIYHPYGDLKVGKTVLNTTEISAQKEFTFTFTFASGIETLEDGSEVEKPVTDSYVYEILDAEGEPVTDESGELVTGTVGNNGEVKIRGGQTIHVKEIPQGVIYHVTESEEAGFTQTGKSGDNGTILPNKTAEASFTNTYKADGQINLHADKVLYNRILNKYQFAFEMYQVREAEEGQETEIGVLKSTASTSTASQIEYREDGTVDWSRGSAAFNALRYTQEDHGKTYRYYILEKIPEPKRAGYTYSKASYEADVTITDNGDGTLTITPVYKAANVRIQTEYDLGNEEEDLGNYHYNEDDSVNFIPAGEESSGESGVEVPSAEFENTYEAKGNTILRAWKSLPARDLDDDEFTFELLDEAGNPILQENTPAETTIEEATEEPADNPTDSAENPTEDQAEPQGAPQVQNPEAESESEPEEGGSDNSDISTSENSAGETTAVTATNKANGTIVFEPDKIAVLNYTEKDIGKTYYYGIREKVGTDETVIYDETVFGYAVKIVDNGDGTLYAEQTLVKPVYDKTDTDKIVSWTRDDAELPIFKNRLEKGSFSIVKTVENPEDADPAQKFTFKVKLIGEEVTDDLIENYTITSATDTEAADKTDENLDGASKNGTLYAPVNGTLQKIKAIHRNLQAPEDGNSGTETIRYSGRTGADTSGNGVDWRITSDGTLIIGKSGEIQTFKNEAARTFDGSATGTYYYTWHPYRSYIKAVRFEGTVYGNGDMNGMFRGCTNLISVNLAGFNTSKTTGLGYLFYGDSNLTSISHIEALNTAGMTWIDNTFYGCSKLTTIDVSNFRTESITYLQNLFYGCSAVEFLDLSGFDLANSRTSPNSGAVVNMGNVFQGCSKLNTVVLGPSFTFKSGSSTCALPTPPNSQQWVCLESGEKLTSSQLASQYNASKAGTWVWESLAAQYQVIFEADGAAGGTKPTWFMAAFDQNLPANTFVKPGQEFDHWVVTKIIKANGTTIEPSSEISYEDNAKISANTYGERDKVYLKAVFRDREASVEMQDGEFTITLIANEKAVFNDIPAGTAYQIFEETPDGWVLVEQSGVSGTIEPLKTAEAKFVNKYEPGTTSVQFFGTKLLDYRAAAADAFHFVLKEVNPENNEEVIKTIEDNVPTQSGGFIQFRPITYTKEGKHNYPEKHVYTVEEIDPQQDTIDWDTHKEIITVTVTELEGGNLSATTEYDDDGVVKFSNMTRPGNLRITKTAEGTTDANKDDEFTFRVTLNNAAGMPLGSEDAIYWYVESPKAEDTSGGAKNAQTENDNQNTENTENTTDAGNAGENTLFAHKTLPMMKNRFAARLLTSEDEGQGGNGEIPARLFNYSGQVETYIVPASGYYKLEVWGGQGGSFINYPMRHEGGPNPWNKEGLHGGYSYMEVWLEKDTVLYVAAGGAGGTLSNYVDSENDSKLNGGWNGGGKGGFALNRYHSSTGGGGASHIAIANGVLSSLSNNQDAVLLVAGGGGGIGWSSTWSTALGYGGGETAGSATNPYNSVYPNVDAGEYKALGGTQTSGYRFGQGQNGQKGTDGGGNAEGSAGGGGGWYGGCAHTWTYSASSSSPDNKGAHSIGGGGGSGHINKKYAGIISGETVAGNQSFPSPSGGTETGHTGNGVVKISPLELAGNEYMLHLDANGGYVDSQWKRIADPEAEVSLPEPTNPGNYFFTGWNTAEDGSGTTYTGIVTGQQLGAQPGQTVTLYAQWLDGNTYTKYTVEHWKQNANGEGYSLYESEILIGKRSTAEAESRVTPDVKEYEGYLFHGHDASYKDGYRIPAVGESNLVVTYKYDLFTYSVIYDGNGATSGQMNGVQTMQGNKKETLWLNSYQKKGSIFTGWNTEAYGTGTAYVDRQEVKNLTTSKNATVTLYAQWLSNEENKLEPTNGVIIVRCKAGESIMIPDLPAGTTYTIEEVDNPAGWTQKGEITGNDGTISANITNQADVTNEYKATGEARLYAHKILEGAPIEEGQFTFELLDAEGNVIDTAVNGAVDANELVDAGDESGEMVTNPYYQTSLVSFDALEFTQEDIGKTFTYTIHEVVTEEMKKTIACDESEVTATVKIEDAGKGVLAATVTYATNLEPIFKNEMKKANLEISKAVTETGTGNAATIADTEFSFTVTLTGADGNVLAGEYATIKQTTDGQETAGTISSGGKVTLKGGEKILIKDLPHGTTYLVTEETLPEYWEQTAAENTTGVLQPGETAKVNFTNNYNPPEVIEYKAKGFVQLTAEKVMVGGEILEEDNFTFELTDEQGNVLQTKACDKISTDEEKVTVSTITFDQINFDIKELVYPEAVRQGVEETVSAKMKAWEKAWQDTYGTNKKKYEETHGEGTYVTLEDYIRQQSAMEEGGLVLKGRTLNDFTQELIAAGMANVKRENTFIYYVREVAGDDPNITYDSTRYYYEVHVVDNGNGTLTATPTMKKMGSTVDEETGEVVPADETVDTVVFTNTKAGYLKVRKEDMYTAKTLTGAEFIIRQKVEEPPILKSGNPQTEKYLYLQGDGSLAEKEYIFTTNKDGTFAVDGIMPGTYELVETKAPEGYVLDEKPIAFEIEGGHVMADGQEVSILTVKNRRGKSVLATGGNGTRVFTATGLSLIALAVILEEVLRRKRRRNRRVR